MCVDGQVVHYLSRSSVVRGARRRRVRTGLPVGVGAEARARPPLFRARIPAHSRGTCVASMSEKVASAFAARRRPKKVEFSCSARQEFGRIELTNLTNLRFLWFL